MDEVNDRGEPITDDTLLVLLNAGAGVVDFVLADPHPGLRWEFVLDTVDETIAGKSATFDRGAVFPLSGRAVALLRACESPAS